jgi:hypothetical protein
MSRLERAPVTFDDAAPLADAIVAKVAKTIVLARPTAPVPKADIAGRAHFVPC